VSLLEEKLGTAVAFKNILFATDFSGVSEAALPYVTAMSLRYGSMVHVVHVLPEVTFLRPGAPDPALIGSIYEDAHSNAQEKIQRLSLRLREYHHKTYVRHGTVPEVITELIRDQNVDLMILGTHGRTGLGKLVMGSVAEEIFRTALCPVLTVGPRVPSLATALQARHDQDLPPIQVNCRRILYATDLKPDAARGCSYAASLAREFRAQLALLHVIEDYGDYLHKRPGPIEATLRDLEELVSHEDDLLYRPEFVAEYGPPGEVILRTAAENAADLIVLGARPATAHLMAATHLSGSTVHKVVVGANCPVLTIRS
jgi:nucleotide-binding universal stress UspA family protein